MIRDPSDGTVREKTPEGINGADNNINGLSQKTPSEGITSGLPITKEKAEELARLEKSREWLRDYNAWLMTIGAGQAD